VASSGGYVVTDQDDRVVSVNGTAEAADGLVSATVSNTGEVIELSLEPKAMRLASGELAAAVRTAIAAARAEARESAGVPPADNGALVDLRAELDRVGAHAQQRMAELSNLARDLSARFDRI